MEIGIYISAASVCVAVLALGLSFKGSRRTDDRDKAEGASQLTRIEATLESVRGGIDDLRVEIRSQQHQINNVSERVARTEESVKTSEKRIDMIEGRKSNDC